MLGDGKLHVRAGFEKTQSVVVGGKFVFLKCK